MKTFNILVLALTFLQIHGQKQGKSSKAQFQNEDFDLNKGEFFYPSPEDKYNDELKGFEEDFGHKLKQKGPFKSQIQNGESHYESLRPDAALPVKKYVVKKPETFHQDTKGMKFSTTVGKPLKMKAKIVQKGSVKHIYLDIPDIQPLASMPKGIRYTAPNYHQQYEGGNSFHKQPIQHQYQQQHPSFSHGGYSNFGPQQSFGHGFGVFRVGKAQGHPGKGVEAYTTYGSQFGSGIKYPPPHYTKFKPIPTPEHSAGNNFNHVLQQYAAPHSYQHGSFTGPQDGQQISHQFDNFGGAQHQAFTQGEHQVEGGQTGGEHNLGGEHQFGGGQQFGGDYQFGSEHQLGGGQQFGGEHQFSGEHQLGGGHQFGAEHQLGGGQQFGGEHQLGSASGDFGSGYNFPRYSQDGKQKFTYEIPKEYQKLFAEYRGSSGTKEQSTNNVPTVVNTFGSDQLQQQQQPQNHQQFQYNFGKEAEQQSQQQVQYDFGQGANQFNKQPEQQQFQHDFGKQFEFLPKPENLFSTQAQNFNAGKENTATNLQQNEMLPQPQQLVQFPQPPQFDNYKQSESINNQQNFGETTDFIPKPAPEQYNAQQYSSSNFEASKPIAEYGQPSEFAPQAARNFQFNQQQVDGTQKTPGLENVSGFDPDLVNIVNSVLNKGEGIPTNNGFRVVKSNENNAIYFVGKPGMSLNAIPNFGGFKPSDFQLNNSGNSNEKREESNTGNA